MNNIEAVDSCTLNDENVAKEVDSFVDTISFLLQKAIEKVDSESPFSTLLMSIAKYLFTDSHFCDEKHNDLLKWLLAQFDNIMILASFVQKYIVFVSSFPCGLKPSFCDNLLKLDDLLSLQKEYCLTHNLCLSHIEGDAQHYLRLALIRLVGSALKPYYSSITDRALFVDYDGTITVNDTCGVGILGGDLFNNDGVNRTEIYNASYDIYLARYKEFVAQTESIMDVDAWLRAYDVFDRDSTAPVEDRGMFKGLKRYSVEIVSRLVHLKENAPYVINRIGLPSLTHVISQSWYHEMVTESLLHNVHYDNLNIYADHIHSSELEYDSNDVCTGHVLPNAAGCVAKQRIMKDILSHLPDVSHSVSMAIGDSLGDLSVLLSVDIAIVLTPSDSFRGICNRFHIQLIPLFDYDGIACNRLRIFVANDWSEIMAVFGYNWMVKESSEIMKESAATVEKCRCTAEQCRLMALTNDHLNAVGGEEMEHAICESIAGGATMIQIRDKTENFERMVEHANQLKSVLQAHNVPLIINDRVDVAIVSNADGVHIGQSDMDASTVRRLIGPHKILGVSAQTPQQAIKAQNDGADYLGVGAVFPTISKDDAGVLGIEGFEAVCHSVKIPVVSIGGVTAKNCGETIRAGAVGIAVISAIFNKQDIRGASRELRDAVEKAL